MLAPAENPTARPQTYLRHHICDPRPLAGDPREGDIREDRPSIGGSSGGRVCARDTGNKRREAADAVAALVFGG